MKQRIYCFILILFLLFSLCYILITNIEIRNMYLRGKNSIVFFNRNPNLPRILFFSHHYVTLSYPEAIYLHTRVKTLPNVRSFSFKRIR